MGQQPQGGRLVVPEATDDAGIKDLRGHGRNDTGWNPVEYVET